MLLNNDTSAENEIDKVTTPGGITIKGLNELEIEVVNCWRNRLIGEKKLPENERFTFQTSSYLNENSELQSSGLMGPVQILSYPYLIIK